MTLRLILTRHAKSDWSGGAQSDFDRPLNARGQAEARALGEWLRSRGYLPGKIIASAARRTVETAELLAPLLDVTEPLDRREALYQADDDTFLAALQGETISDGGPQTMLVVGHNPTIAHVARSLLHDHPRHPRFVDYPTGASAVIDFALPQWAEIGPGTGALRDFTVPDDLT